jgi:hypothetical protein
VYLFVSSCIQVLDTTALDKATAGMAYIALVSAAIYMHFWIKPNVDEVTTVCEDLRKEISHLVHIQNTDASSVSHETPTALASGILIRLYQNFFFLHHF